MSKRRTIKQVGVGIFIATTLLNMTAWAQPKINAEADSLNKYFSRLNAYHERSQKDEFTDMPSFDDLNGKPFRAEIEFKGHPGDSVSGPYSCGNYYQYKDGEIKFNYYDLQSACIKYLQKRVEKYRGHNAYGASASVQKIQVLREEIAVIAPKFEFVYDYRYKTKANAQLAKDLVSDVILVYEGVLLSPGACNSDHIEPTVTEPEEYSIQICQIKVSINRVSYQRKSTGEVLAEWPEGRSVK